MDIIGKRNIYFLISGLILLIGIVSLILYGFNLSIDFTGGSRLEVDYKGTPKITKQEVNTITQKYSASVYKVRYQDADTALIRTTPINQQTKNKIMKDLSQKYKGIHDNSFETIGPTIGNETKNNAFKAVLIASLAITAYVAFAFRQVSRPVASWKFGVVAVLTLLHDVIVTIGIFSLFGDFLDVEIDPLFITALLTIMGFSVHDTIVVFDRIRENIKKSPNTMPFDQVVNNAINETLNRSLNTSLTVIFVLVTLLLFGGESIRWFVVALLIGIISGTYSSIFTAAPLLVVWQNWDLKKKNKKN